MIGWIDYTVDNKPLKTAARFISEQIEHDLKRRYGGRVDTALYDEITTEVQKALKNGGDVRKVVLTLMSQRAGDSMMEIGYGQDDRVEAEANAVPELMLVEIRADLQGIRRVAVLRRARM